MFFQNLPGDGQTESGPVVLRRVEGVEDLFSDVGLDAWSVILDLDEELIGASPRLEPCVSSDPDRLGRIHQQVQYGLLDSSGVGARPERFVPKVDTELGASTYEMRLCRVRRVAESHRQIDGSARFALSPDGAQGCSHELVQPVDLRNEARRRAVGISTGTSLQALHVDANRRERIPHLVCKARREIPGGSERFVLGEPL